MFKTKTAHPEENAHSLQAATVSYVIALKEQLMVMDDIFELDR